MQSQNAIYKRQMVSNVTPKGYIDFCVRMRGIRVRKSQMLALEMICKKMKVMLSMLIPLPHIKALKRIFVIEDVEAWNPNLRSKTAIRTSDTRYFTDPSIATAALGIGPQDLVADLRTFGFVFEALCVRDLRVYAEAINGKVYHYRDKNGLECDAVIHLRDGRYGLVEIKLGGEKLIEEGVVTLKSLADKIDSDKMKRPSFLMVLTATGNYAYQREDGVYVVPIGTLKD